MSEAARRHDGEEVMDEEEDDEAVEDTSAKYVDTSVTMEELRKHDENWRQVSGSERQRFAALIREQIRYFQDKPYLDYDKDSVTKYTDTFLAQPQGYGWSLDFDPNCFCELAYEGFLTTSLQIPAGRGSQLQILLPWIDPKRNSLDFADVHIPRQVRKRSRNYTMTVDAAFDEVILRCIWQHGEGWLYRGLRWLLRKLFREGYTGKRPINVGVHSFELWDNTGELVAGDLGYSVGAVYTSMTGFRLQHTQGAGKVQLLLTAALLQKMGYEWWDLGMVMRYKAQLGARVIAREAFVERLRRDRDRPVRFGHDRIAGQELLRGFLQARSDAASAGAPQPPAGTAAASEGGEAPAATPPAAPATPVAAAA